MFLYESLHLKWRPKSFKDFIGHDIIINIIINILKKKKISNSFLFYGPKGVGKTSLARLFSRCLNCNLGITYNPCFSCFNCKSIISGKSTDVIEIDAASRTRIEDTKDFLDKVIYLPICMRYKIYIIDEVHMLSRYSFNALLKTLEEPPIYVKFILATTDIEKIPDTILSRCMCFYLKPLSYNNILDRLKYILIKENIKFEIDALKKISIYSNGSMRDCLILVDQLLMFNSSNIITLNNVNNFLYEINDDIIFLFLKYIFLDLKDKIINILKNFYDNDIDYYKLVIKIIENLHNIFLIKNFNKLENKILFDISNFCYKNLLSLSKIVSKKDLNFFYFLFIYIEKNLRNSFNKRLFFEFNIFRIFMYKNKLIDFNNINLNFY